MLNAVVHSVVNLQLVRNVHGHRLPVDAFCRMQEMIKKAFGGILLVDEAYYLYNAANEKDYGQESIEILLNVMEEQKEDLIVTLAGCVRLGFLWAWGKLTLTLRCPFDPGRCAQHYRVSMYDEKATSLAGVVLLRM